MDIVSHDVIWDHLKEFDMEGRMSCAVDATSHASPQEWTLYPNPAADWLVLDMNQSVTTAEVFHIYNPTGQCVKQGQVTSQNTFIDLATLPCGVHWLTVGTQTKRFVIQ